MNRYLCWLAGESPERYGADIIAETVEEAAEEHIENMFDADFEFKDYIVMVKLYDSDAIIKVRVEVDTEITYYGYIEE